MITKLHDKYFQKSKAFLFPALGIKKTNRFQPVNTYLSLDGRIGADEMKLICQFTEDESETYKNFEKQMLLSNPLFHEKLVLNKTTLYVFNMEIYKADWFNFILGKYSKLSKVLKRAIKAHYGEGTVNWEYMETYLYPENYFEMYAKLLEAPLKTLEDVGELTDSCNMEKETLKISLEDLVVSVLDDSFAE